MREDKFNYSCTNCGYKRKTITDYYAEKYLYCQVCEKETLFNRIPETEREIIEFVEG